MPFHLNESKVNFPVFIADIPDECLLGADFLAQFQCHLSMADYSILLTLPDGSTTVLRCTGSSPSTESRRFFRRFVGTSCSELRVGMHLFLVTDMCIP